jgi:hypothetical protein
MPFASRGSGVSLGVAGSRLSDLLEVEVHKDPTHHWMEARLPAANRASAALFLATHIARERH